MPRTRGCLAVWLSLALTAPYARAQSGGEEVIEDPELAGSQSSFTSDDSGDQVIEDPELAGSSSTSSSAASSVSSSSSDSSAPVSELHLTLHVRGNRDL